MPLDIAWQLAVLLPELLLMALAEDALALLVGGHDIVGGMVFGDSHEARALRQPVEHLVQMALHIEVCHHWSYSGLSSDFFLRYSKTSMMVVSATLEMT